MGRVLNHFENGMVGSMYDCFEKEAMATVRRSNVSYFESLEEYIEEYSGFSDLDLENFRYIFLYYFLFGSLIFIVFLMHRLVKGSSNRFFLLQLRSLIEKLTRRTRTL